MSSVLSNFPYSIDDEPSSDWTVEHLLQWHLLRAHADTDEEYEKQVKELKQRFEEGRKELWKCHEQESSNSKVDGNEEEEDDTENVNPQEQQSVKDDMAKSQPNDKSNSAAITTIHVTVFGGPYEGQSYTLKPKTRFPCFVGRSTAQKFKKRGMSLAKDPEVSTTHGRFEIKGGKAYFTDLGSTNGTLFGEVELEDNEPFELCQDMELKIGGTDVRIKLE